MPKLYNHHKRDFPEDAVYVGRPSGFGNIFVSTENKSLVTIKVKDREMVIKCYELLIGCYTLEDLRCFNWDLELTKANLLLAKAEWIRNNLKYLKDKDLVCWCAPIPCHGDVLLRLANEQVLSHAKGFD